MLAIEPSRIPVALGSSFVARDVCCCAWRQFERKPESRGRLWQNNLGASSRDHRLANCSVPRKGSSEVRDTVRRHSIFRDFATPSLIKALTQKLRRKLKRQGLLPCEADR